MRDSTLDKTIICAAPWLKYFNHCTRCRIRSQTISWIIYLLILGHYFSKWSHICWAHMRPRPSHMV